jgi:hypothetical protein
MERWTFDLDRIRKNWERTAPPPEVPAEKVCPSCGAKMPRGGSPPQKTAEAAKGSSSPGGTAEPSAKAAKGSAIPRVTGETSAWAATGSAIFDGTDSPRAMPSRFAQVEAPRDPYPDAQAMLSRVRGLVQRELRAREPIVRPFLDEAEGIIQRLAAKPGEGDEESPPVDKKKLRADLDKALGDLEDMIALWSGIGR